MRVLLMLKIRARDTLSRAGKRSTRRHRGAACPRSQPSPTQLLPTGRLSGAARIPPGGTEGLKIPSARAGAQQAAELSLPCPIPARKPTSPLPPSPEAPTGDAPPTSGVFGYVSGCGVTEKAPPEARAGCSGMACGDTCLRAAANALSGEIKALSINALV